MIPALLPFVPLFQLWALYELAKKAKLAQKLKYEFELMRVQACHREADRMWREASGPDIHAQLDRALLKRDECYRMGREMDRVQGNGLQFLSMLRPAPKVQGAFWESKQWHAVFNGRGWLGPLKMTAGEASDWHIAQLDAMSARQPFANIQLHKWTGSKWQRVA